MSDDLRRLLGTLAGGLAGRKVGKQEPLGGITGAFAGGVAGLFTADMINILDRLARPQEGGPSGNVVTIDRTQLKEAILGLLALMAQASAVSAALSTAIERGFGIDVETIMKERYGELDEAAEARLWLEHVPAIKNAFGAEMRNSLNTLNARLLPELGILPVPDVEGAVQQASENVTNAMVKVISRHLR